MIIKGNWKLDKKDIFGKRGKYRQFPVQITQDQAWSCMKKR